MHPLISWFFSSNKRGTATTGILSRYPALPLAAWFLMSSCTHTLFAAHVSNSKKSNFWSQFFYFFVPLTRRYLRCSVAKTIQSQTMRKLNPMNRPRTPPQSATRDPKEKASTSLWTRIDLLVNAISNLVSLTVGLINGRSVTYEYAKMNSL